MATAAEGKSEEAEEMVMVEVGRARAAEVTAGGRRRRRRWRWRRSRRRRTYVCQAQGLPCHDVVTHGALQIAPACVGSWRRGRRRGDGRAARHARVAQVVGRHAVLAVRACAIAASGARVHHLPVGDARWAKVCRKAAPVRRGNSARGDLRVRWDGLVGRAEDAANVRVVVEVAERRLHVPRRAASRRRRRRWRRRRW